MVESYKVGLGNEIKEKPSQNKIQDTLKFLGRILVELIGKLSSHDLRSVLSEPENSEGIEGLNTVKTLVVP